VEAIRATRESGEPVTAAAQQALEDSLTLVHGRALTGHTGEVSALAIAPGGKPVTGSTDGTTWVWDLKQYSPQPLAPRGDGDPVTAIDYAPDGRLVIAGQSGIVRVWDPKNPAVAPLALRGHARAVNVLAFAPDGRLVTGGADSTIRVWDLKKNAPESIILEGRLDRVQNLAVAPDGRLGVGGYSHGHSALLCDLTKPKAEPLYLAGYLGWSWKCVAFAPDGRLVTANNVEGFARVWDVKNTSAAPVMLKDLTRGFPYWPSRTTAGLRWAATTARYVSGT
jgi:WD40 repeat protein